MKASSGTYVSFLSGVAIAMLVVACGGGEEGTQAAGGTPGAGQADSATAPELPLGSITNSPANQALSLVRELDAKVDIPDYYPSDAPRYPGRRPSTARIMYDDSVSVQYGLPDSVAKVNEWARAFLDENGWQIQDELSMSRGESMTAMKGERRLNIFISLVGTVDENLTLVSINVTPES
jgi:hypothetical protein